jgi:hypothetical protein
MALWDYKPLPAEVVLEVEKIIESVINDDDTFEVEVNNKKKKGK